ncbi:MAG: EpsI family protein [Gemmataceae bacterium]|nr:EpsI family protein [Gemmataceae bacterium]
MLRTALIVAAVAVLVAAGVLAGIRSNRFGVQEDLRAAAQKVYAVPKVVGPWESAQDLELDPKVKDRTECESYLSRVYTHRETKQSVSVLILCGEPGPIGAHTPEICYGATGYDTTGPKAVRAVPVPGGSANYFAARFKKSADAPLQVCWAWGVDGNWYASDTARGEFALRSALYKIYVHRPVSAAAADAPDDTVHEFMTAFLPEVKKTLAAQ